MMFMRIREASLVPNRSAFFNISWYLLIWFIFEKYHHNGAGISKVFPKGFIHPSPHHTHKYMIGLSRWNTPVTFLALGMEFAWYMPISEWHIALFLLCSQNILLLEKQKNTPRQTTKDAAIKLSVKHEAKPRSVCVRLQLVHSSSKQM